MRGWIVIAALSLAACTATDIDLPPPYQPRAAIETPPAQAAPQTELRPVPELPDLQPAGGIARTKESPLSGRRSGIADDMIERRLDCNSEPTPSNRDTRNAFLHRCPPYGR
jgi:hypothetical protein